MTDFQMQFADVGDVHHLRRGVRAEVRWLNDLLRGSLSLHSVFGDKCTEGWLPRSATNRCGTA